MTDGETREDRDRSKSPWYCPKCTAWVGYQLDECVTDGHDRPRRPLRWDDVEKPSFEVTYRDRLLAKVRLSGADPVERWISGWRRYRNDLIDWLPSRETSAEISFALLVIAWPAIPAILAVVWLFPEFDPLLAAWVAIMVWFLGFLLPYNRGETDA
ncbi:hypothetical protein [Halorubrum sp. CBA1229]|uniref:hypothetical protein n=1 Tax=Halorubrum sp. CBA1229 TaxID=1853699 RepID=UPI0015945231|nr:hypothetical protein [Halorubrum sp. CBA1229]QKY16419.1 hypothetical protein Hrr1229_005825 [Halorubrum sp. CBA1229]